ncbi:MAG: MTH1187 family thiamine-binding protein [Candidatus Sumerlaeaceae bacterium]
MLAEFSIAPLLGHEEHLSGPVAEMLKIVDESGLPYELHAMGTIIEGEWNEVMPVIEKCYRYMSERFPRVSVIIKIDDARGRTGRLRGKVESVERLVGKALRRAS